jgi:hypothetical protein
MQPDDFPKFDVRRRHLQDGDTIQIKEKQHRLQPIARISGRWREAMP